MKLLREPEAAALAYGLLQTAKQVVLVFDLGGGTFDVSVLEVGDGFVEVIATSGDGHLGGDDFDQMIVNWTIEQFNLQWPSHTATFAAHLKGFSTAGEGSINQMERLQQIATQVKIDLSTKSVVTVEVPNLFGDMGLAAVNITRSKFEVLCKPLYARLLKPLREVAIMSGVNLPGESGQLGLTEDLFNEQEEENGDNGGSHHNNGDSINKKSAMDINGKQLRSMQLEGRRDARAKKKLKGSTNKELRRLQKEGRDPSLALFPGGQQLDAVILVGGATRMKAIEKLVRVTTDIEPKRSVNPDEAVCLGAGIWAGILDGTIQNMQVMSVWQAAMYRAFKEERDKGNTDAVEFFQRVGMEEGDGTEISKTFDLLERSGDGGSSAVGRGRVRSSDSDSDSDISITESEAESVSMTTPIRTVKPFKKLLSRKRRGTRE